MRLSYSVVERFSVSDCVACRKGGRIVPLGVIISVISAIFEVIHLQLVNLTILCSDLPLEQHRLLLHHLHLFVQSPFLASLQLQL